MVKGLVLGKFLPFHIGHQKLIQFGLAHCDELTILICASNKEIIGGQIRLKWVAESFEHLPQVKPILLDYDENLLPNTSVSSQAVSKIWADYIIKKYGRFDLVFSSEHYGEYLAEYLNGKHIAYDIDRTISQTSGSEILQKPLTNWHFLAKTTQPYFVKKIAILGTESTGKSTLTENLASHYDTVFVPEMARDIVAHTSEVTYENLHEIALLHAETIVEKITKANKLLFIDTDITITKSYSKFLFDRVLAVSDFVENANDCDLYLYLDNDAPYVQDGTRLSESERNLLDTFHLKELQQQRKTFHILSGDWKDRFIQAKELIDGFLR